VSGECLAALAIKGDNRGGGNKSLADLIYLWFCMVFEISNRRVLFPTAVTAGLLLLGISGTAVAKPRSTDALDDRPERLVPKQSRSEEERDRLEAAAMFAAGRTLEQREESAAALKMFERAARLDPQATPVLRELVPLAYSINRRAEALRYAIKLAELDNSDPQLAQRIGQFFAEEGSPKRGAKLLEKALSAVEAEPNPTAARTQIRVELGRVYFLVDRFVDATKLFDKVLQALDKPEDFGLSGDERRRLVGDDGLTYELIAATFLEVNRPDDAEKLFRKLNDLAPNPAVLSLNQARVEEKRGHHAEALAKLDAYFKARPSDLSLPSLELLKNVLKESKQTSELLPRLEKLHKSMPDSAPVSYFLAEQYRQDDKLSLARPLYEAILKKGPSVEAYRALTEVYRKLDQLDALAALLGEVVEKSGSFEVLEKEAKTIASDDALAARLYKAVREKHGKAAVTDAAALEGAAALAAERKQFDMAGEFYDLAIKANPKDKADLLLSWGLALFMADRNADAAKVFRRGIDEGKLPTEKPAFEFYLAGALEMDGHTDEALSIVRKMLDEKKPKESRYFARLPWILFHAKRNEEAFRAYQDLIARFDGDYSSEENRDAMRSAREALSALCVTLHKPAEAEELLQQSLDEFPDDPGGNNDLGYLWADEGKHLKRGLAMIQKAVAAEPDNSAYRDSLGWALFRLGRDDEAVTELKKAAAGDHPDATVLEHLGDVYDHLPKSDDALKNWKRALAGYEKEKDDEHIKAVRQKIDSHQK
jgi:tetratricopeptide (TPR) repeat protein